MFVAKKRLFCARCNSRCSFSKGLTPFFVVFSDDNFNFKHVLIWLSTGRSSCRYNKYLHRNLPVENRYFCFGAAIIVDNHFGQTALFDILQPASASAGCNVSINAVGHSDYLLSNVYMVFTSNLPNDVSTCCHSPLIFRVFSFFRILN